jgi:hypothetical protein
MALITYANKSTGDTFTAANANEIKTVVNANALNAANTALGDNTVTINATSGVATFNDICATAPAYTEYFINNSLIDVTSIVSVNVQTPADSGYCSLVTVYCGPGFISLAVNDGFTAFALNPIISFQILA